VSDLVIIGHEKSKEQLVDEAVGPKRGGPHFIRPGTGGKLVRMPSGAVIAAGGECLRSALKNGGVIVGESQPETFQKEVGTQGATKDLNVR